MVQQTVESKFSEYGLSNAETNVSTSDKQFPLSAKKTALRDVQNENRIPNRIENSPKDRVCMDTTLKVSGIKRSSPKDAMSPPHHQSQTSNASNAHLVYVRRKPDSETGKSTICGADCLNSTHLDYVEKTTQLKPPVKEPKVSSLSSFAPVPVASLACASGKTSVPFAVGNSNMRISPSEPNYHHVASTPLANNLKSMKNMHWEERYRQLCTLLKKYDESHQEDYLEMLHSLSSVELSRHAIELEKRSIQLSLEEAKELQRVGVLNILGKSLKNITASTSCEGEPEKQ